MIPIVEDEGPWRGFPLALYRTTADRQIVAANPEFLACFRYESEEAVTGVNSEALFLDPEVPRRLHTECMARGTLLGIDAQMQRADATLFWARLTGRSLHMAGGEPVGCEWAVLDVEDLKSVIEGAHYPELQRSEAKFRTLAEGSPNMIFVIADGRIVYANPMCEEMLGVSRQDGLAPTFDVFRLVAPESLELAQANRRRHDAGEDVPPCEYTLLTPSGRKIHGIYTSKLVDFTGTRATLGIITDITERKLAEEAQARLTRAVEQSAESILITDAAGTIVYVNPAFERVSGWSRDQAIGQNPRILKSGQQDAAFYRRMWETLARGQVWSGRLVNRHRNGSLFEEEATISPVRDASDRIVNYVAVKRDVSDEVRMQRHLLQTQKMEAIGRLAGGVAHDFNNLLGVITGYGEIVLRGLPPDDLLRGKLDQLLKAAERAASLTRQLLAFGRKQAIEPKVLDLNAIVSETETMLARLIGEDIELTTALDSRVGNIQADSGQIVQVVMNLALNARDAMPGGGRLAIHTGNAELDPAYAAAHPPCQPGRYVVLSVSDTGSGMDPDTQSRIFEPFFTTKVLGHGSGLGLATAYAIVKQNGGYIWCYSEVGVGTTFKVYLPQVTELPAPPEEVQQEVASLAGHETVLLVEDEAELRGLFRETLEDGGYTVLVARSGSEALEISAEYQEPIDLLLTDVIMPHMTGPALAQRIRHDRPVMKLLFVSGYTDEPVLRRGVIGPRAPLLNKPFGGRTLLGKVREILDQA